jgi:hypothetical protein
MQVSSCENGEHRRQGALLLPKKRIRMALTLIVDVRQRRARLVRVSCHRVHRSLVAAPAAKGSAGRSVQQRVRALARCRRKSRPMGGSSAPSKIALPAAPPEEQRALPGERREEAHAAAAVAYARAADASARGKKEAEVVTEAGKGGEKQTGGADGRVGGSGSEACTVGAKVCGDRGRRRVTRSRDATCAAACPTLCAPRASP